MAKLDPVSILGPGGAIARRLPSYEHRQEQLAMAQAVARAIERPGHLVVEAGTGVGKSFAYLVPAIQATADPKKKVVVSTHTIALQEQLLRKDIPFLRSVMPQEFSAVLVKGRSNYISLRRLDVAIKRQDLLFQRPEEIDQLVTLRMWSNRTTDGSRSDLDFRPMPSVWEAVQSEDGNCLGRECPRHSECFFFKARRRMQTANVLVVNHALFVTDLALRGRRLRPAARVPGRHHRRGAHARGRRRRAPGLAALQHRDRLHRWPGCTTRGAARACCRRIAKRWTRRSSRRRGRGTAAEDFFNRAANWHPGPAQRLQRPAPAADRLERVLLRGAAAAGRRPSTAAPRRSRSPRSEIELTAAEERCRSMADQVASWIRQSAEDAVYWVEVEQKTRLRVRLAAAPLDVGPSLRNLLFTEVATCVLTSATLCVGSPPRFDFFQSRIGLTAAETLALGSPFDYANQVTRPPPQEPARPLRSARRVRAARRSAPSPITSSRRTARRSSCSPRTRCSRPPRAR